jgi:translation initiation factor IF-2
MSSKTEKAAPPTGIKVHELAKEMGVPSKALLEKANELGIKVKSPSNVLTHGQADRLRAKLGGGKKLKAELEESKTRLLTAKKKPGGKSAKTAAGASTAEVQAEIEEAVSAGAAEELTPVVEALPPEVAAPVPDAVAEAAPAEAPAVEAPAEPAPVEAVAAAAPAPVAEIPEPEMPAPAAPADAPAAPPAAEAPPSPTAPAAQPKRILAGREVAPPIQRAVTRTDPRFGVVVPAPPPEQKPAAPAAKGRRGGTVQVEAKTVEEFKPQVSYPAIPDAFGSEEDKGANRGAVARGGRRGFVRGGPGIKGVSRGPRRGVALLQEDDRYRGRRPKARMMRPKPVVKREGPAVVTSPVTIKALCEALGIKAADLIGKFFQQGKVVTINTILSEADAELYALEFDPLKYGILIKKARDVEEEALKKVEIADKPEDMAFRAPVVTIMGHVDHGKTSLLDYIRHAKVAAEEAGGITQHIGAYKVKHSKGEISFLDTPGHKAFTEMRARGANVTDVVVLVVSAVDGVMPQTEEAISHARQAKRKLVVALNKIDLPEANPDRIKGQLAAKEIFVEGYGGDIGCVAVSAKTGAGVDDLLDRILLEAEMLELKANPSKPALGTVIEAHKDQGRGIVCTLLVQEGTLRPGDVIVSGHTYGPVRQLFSDTGRPLSEAGPSTPVVVTGLNDVPLPGERCYVLDDVKEAAEIAEQRAMRLRQEGLVKRTHVTLENVRDMLEQGAVAALKLVLKVDVQGSLAPLRNAIMELSGADARIDIIHDGVGAINETDVLLADASDAIVLGFNVTADPNARRSAEERSVDIRTYKVIYDIVDEMRQALEGMLKPIEREVVQGHVAVRQTFKITKVGTVAGCFVTDGIITRNSNVRVVRDGKPVWTGKLAGLKRVKDDVKEVRSGFECGIKLESYDDVKPGDALEAFITEQVKRTLQS